MAHPGVGCLPGDDRAAHRLLQPAALLRAGAPRRIGEVALRVATFNIRSAIGPGPFPDRWWTHVEQDRLEQIASVISALDAELVGLQEVALLNVDGTISDQATALAELTRMEVRFGTAWHFSVPEPHYGEAPRGAGLYGNAILSQLPITASQLIVLPQAAESAEIEPAGIPHSLAGLRYTDVDRPLRQPRAMLQATVRLPDGRDLTVISTHFSHIGSGERLLQAGAVAEQLRAAPVGVALGDLNAPIESRELQPLRQFEDAFEAAGVPAGDERRQSMNEPDARIDHVLLRGLRATGCRVAREAGDASDHWPVVADLATA